MLILAGITIATLFGENGIIKKASTTKTNTDIESLREQLELAKTPIIIENLGRFDVEQYFELIEKEEIINNKETDVIDLGNGMYEITTKLDYVFEMKLVPNKETPIDAEIKYLGEKGKLPPRVRNISITGKTETSIDIKVDVSRLNNGTLSYYYKEDQEGENEYRVIKENTSDLTAKIENLDDGKIYNIKVIVKNENGEHVLIIKEAIKQLVKTITLDKSTVSMRESETVQLNATVLPENAEDKTLTWSSNNEDIAVVNENGLVTAKAVGTTIITARATDGGGAETSCNLIVKIPVTGIELNNTTATVEGGKTITLIATISPDDATNKAVTWSSSNTSVATVNQSGVVTARNVGTTVIKATSQDDPNINKVCNVTVFKSANTLLTEGKYVYYPDNNNTKRKSVVMYPASSANGLQIATVNQMSSKSIVAPTHNAGLQYADGSTPADAAKVWNNLFKDLNDVCKTWINTEYATDARCFGSATNFKNPTRRTLEYELVDASNSILKNIFLDVPNLEDSDFECSSRSKLNLTSLAWYASGTIVHQSGIGAKLNLYRFNQSVRSTTLIQGVNIIDKKITGSSNTAGIVPIFKLRTDLKVIGGAGTESSPYILGK